MKLSLFICALSSTLIVSQVYDDSQRSDICDRNMATCTVICYNHDKGQPLNNSCDPSNFNYECVCAGNYRPSLTNNTLPAATAKCQIEGQACKAGCNGNPTCSEKCDLDHICLGIEDKGNNKTQTTNSTSLSASITITAESAKSSKPSIFNDSSNANRIGNFILPSILGVLSFSFYLL